MSSFTIIKPGLFTTIQDMGRYGYRKFGIPLSGALDKYSAGLANALVNKPITSAVIELLMTGPKIKFNSDTYIAVTGADISPKIEEADIRMNMATLIRKGQHLSFGKIKWGAVSYISCGNEILSEIILGSKSYSKDITPINQFYPGQLIYLDKNTRIACIPSSSAKVQKEHFFTRKIKALKGPEFELLLKRDRDIIMNEYFIVSKEYNRMGYKLEGHPIINERASMISSSVMPGTVQLTPNGQLIILMNDCQTTGGYPRILHLPQDSINQVAQKKPGDEFLFEIQI
jgi:biotin-dependent carboxylase-like uncharacterized protein